MMIAGRYAVEEQVGSGGMADVYRAKDCKLGRTVAIKILKPEFSSDANFVNKFRAEAQAAAGLEHPNIVNVYDVGNQNGCYYIIMEYVPGITLKDYIEKKGKLNYRETLSIAIQVARGIQAAHANNIIHRDIKPQNIIISSDGKVKVTDFGIARAASEETIHSDVMGSVHYSSPEQARNGYVSNRSDIYSLGIVMYEMVTGQVPFDGDSAVEVAIKHLQDEIVPPSQYAPDLPISLEKIILKCTQKSADRRYETIDSLLADLRKALINPYEDFVTIAAADTGATRVLTDAEAKEIQENAVASQYAQTSSEPEEEIDDKYAYIYEDNQDEEEEDEEEGRFLNSRMERVVNILRIVVLVVIIVIVIYILGSFFGLFNFGSRRNNASEDTQTSEEVERVEMISVLGLTLSQAQEAVDDLGLIIEQDGEQASEVYNAGEIISQSVTKGEMVDRGSTVQVVIASDAAKDIIYVPDVVGYTSDSATNMLQEQGFTVSREFQYSTEEAGTVIEQSPNGGSTASAGDVITLYVSQGSESTSVPSVVGISEGDARNALGNAGLNVGTVSQEYSNSVAEGNVISQSVSAGSTVSEGSSVDLVVSLGTQETTYYIKSQINPPNVTLRYADIYLYKSESDELIQSGTGITDFPFTVEVHGITGASQGTLVIEWYYTDANGNDLESDQEQQITFKQE